jgi:hypothetical protein
MMLMNDPMPLTIDERDTIDRRREELVPRYEAIMTAAHDLDEYRRAVSEIQRHRAAVEQNATMSRGILRDAALTRLANWMRS